MSSASVLRPHDRSVDIDYSDTEHQHQLQRSLDLTCRLSDRNTGTYPSRKHSWNASHTSLESDCLSEVSGQFDDAEESGSPLPGHRRINAAGDPTYSPSSHSVKRQRSKDWPRQSSENVSTWNREHASGSTRQRWGFHHYGRQSHGSPRSPRHGRAGRRSRFVEGHMNDTVSEKPPSIFFRDEARNIEPVRSGSRQSGIFRFGKAIASAFNPFGGWGSVSEIWKSSHDESKPQEGTNDRLRQAELAYEELKRSGYQGTQKGCYMQNLGANAALPDETWRTIQEKMEYVGGQQSRQSSGNTTSHLENASGSSSRPLSDLRKAKSSLGLPSMKKSDGMSSLLQHLDGRGHEVRHQKSRKDMQRQAKLLKRVSDLEGKLQRARRELQELSGEEQLLALTQNDERPYQRKFIPGALPSLPSERLLHDPDLITPLSPLRERTQPPAAEPESQVEVSKTRHLTPKPWRKSSSRSAQSPSRKRKSPDPESRQPDPNTQTQSPTVYIQEDAPEPVKTTRTPIETDPEPAKTPFTTSPSRQAKIPKTARGESPGSVERKQKQRRSPAVENATPPGNEDRGSQPMRATTRNRSATPVLRIKRGRGDLRSTISPGHDRVTDLGVDENKENAMETERDGDDGYNECERDASDKAGLDQDVQQQQNPDSHTPTPTPRRKARYEYIPPVPPLPKDLAATAAKVDRRLAREMGKRRVQREKDGKRPEGFQWPEDIF
ncbi:hypothetical protein BJY04DRAFT_202196 [Aspergillus karnatakaensis]|uniref:putative nuclear RNA binding protein n=1 Tax=Aspergillus karnatakaensis TaxID=1810916 RepID=UPI003CCD6CB4